MEYFYDIRTYDEVVNQDNLKIESKYESFIDFDSSREELENLLNKVNKKDVVVITNLYLGNNIRDTAVIINKITSKCYVKCLNPKFCTFNTFGKQFISALNIYVAESDEVLDNEHKENIKSQVKYIESLKGCVGEDVVQEAYNEAVDKGTLKAFNEVLNGSHAIGKDALTIMQLLEIRKVFSGYKYIDSNGRLWYKEKFPMGTAIEEMTCKINGADCRGFINNIGEVIVYSLSVVSQLKDTQSELYNKVNKIRESLNIDYENQLLEPVIFENIRVATEVVTGKLINAKWAWQTSCGTLGDALKAHNKIKREEKVKEEQAKKSYIAIKKLSKYAKHIKGDVEIRSKSDKYTIVLVLNTDTEKVRVLKCWDNKFSSAEYSSLDEFILDYIKKVFKTDDNIDMLHELICNNLVYGNNECIGELYI